MTTVGVGIGVGHGVNGEHHVIAVLVGGAARGLHRMGWVDTQDPFLRVDHDERRPGVKRGQGHQVSSSFGRPGRADLPGRGQAHEPAVGQGDE
jgi:hypothetical protein